MEVYEFVCEHPDCPRNGEPWLSIAKRPPSVCTTCKSREWNGVKVQRRQQKKVVVELPKPTRVRSLEDDE
jgi:hypothetical protein